MRHEFADRGVDLREAMEDSMAQPSKQPPLDDEDRLFDFRLVHWASWPRRQDGGAVMGRQLGIGAIDKRIVEAGLDAGGLGIVRDEQMRNAADRFEGADMGVDPVRE